MCTPTREISRSSISSAPASTSVTASSGPASCSTSGTDTARSLLRRMTATAMTLLPSRSPLPPRRGGEPGCRGLRPPTTEARQRDEADQGKADEHGTAAQNQPEPDGVHVTALPVLEGGVAHIQRDELGDGLLPGAVAVG